MSGVNLPGGTSRVCLATAPPGNSVAWQFHQATQQRHLVMAPPCNSATSHQRHLVTAPAAAARTWERAEGESVGGDAVLRDLPPVDGSVQDVVELQLVVVADGAEVEGDDKRGRGARVRRPGSAQRNTEVRFGAAWWLGGDWVHF